MSGAHVEPLTKNRVGRPKQPKNWRNPTLLAITIGFVVATAWSWNFIDMTLLTLFGGFSDLGNLLVYMFPPIFDNFPEALRATIETIWMALIGTTIAVVLSVPLAFLAARNTSPHPLVFAVARGVITLTRAIPTLVLAAVFSISLGIGPFPGIVALGLHSVGMIGHSSARATWVVPVVSQTTSSLFSMDWLSWVNCPRPESLSERFGYLPSGYFSSGL